MAGVAPRWYSRARVAGFFATALLLDVLLSTEGRAQSIIAGVALLLAPVLAGTAAVIVVGRRESRPRAGWYLVAAAAGAWAVGWGIQSFGEVFGSGPAAGPSGADVGFLAFLPLAILAALLMNPGGPPREPVGFVLDGVIAAVGLSLLSHQLVIRPLFEAGGSGQELWVGVALAVGDLVLVSLLTMLAIRRRRLRVRSPVPSLEPGIALLAAAMSAFLAAEAHGAGSPWPELAMAGWFGGFMLIGLGGLRAVAGIEPPRVRSKEDFHVSVLPLAMMAAGAVAVLPDLARGPALTVNLVLGYSGQFLVVVRLLVAIVENGRLHRDMQRKVSELEQAYDRLAELDELKSDFVATASHELRTPLTAVQGFIETLLRPEILANRDETREYLMIMRTSAARLRALIENLLLVSRIEQAGAVGNVGPLDLGALAEELVREHSDGSHHLVLDLPGDEVVVRMDRMNARTVVENLLSNAKKFSPLGSRITVAVDANGDRAELSVADSGPGIPPEEREQLFEKFFRGRGSAGITSGSGLGLYIVRRLADAVGGSVHLDHRYEEGARFLVRLPLVAATALAPEPLVTTRTAAGL